MTAPLIELQQVARHYRARRGMFGPRATLRAVDGVSLSLQPGRTLGLVGESGCGKSTTGRLALGLIAPTSGAICFDGAPLPPPHSAAWRGLRQRMQMVFQDPLGALDRRLTVGAQVAEPLAIHGLAAPAERNEQARAAMASVGLRLDQAGRYPHELSGGQRQRVVLARALVLHPRLLVLDEPISALDVSIQAQVVNLLLDLQAERGLAYLFISHDLKVVRQMSHEVAVMYLGRIVEQGEAERLFRAPQHPYTKALVSAIPEPASRGKPRMILRGDPPNPTDLPSGCAFRTRCPFATTQCAAEVPALRPLDDGRLVACHLAGNPPLRRESGGEGAERSEAGEVGGGSIRISSDGTASHLSPTLSPAFAAERGR